MRGILLALSLFVLAGPCVAADEGSTDATSPETVVEELHAALIHIMRHGRELGYDGRFRYLQPVVAETHDLPYIARLVLGRHWRELEPGQRTEFVDVFTRLVLATYADQFRSYDGERFETLEVKPLPRKRMLVETRLVESDGDQVDFDYMLHQRNGRWLIINIVADGVSDLAMKRTEYGALLAQQGFAALVKQLEAKIDGFAHGAGSG